MKNIKMNISMLAFVMVSILFAVSSCKEDDPIALTSIALNKTTTSIAVGANETLTVVFTPIDATNKTLQWYSDNSDIASVDGMGVVTGVKMGKTKISVYSVLSETIVSTCEVTVTPAAGTVITINGNITENQTWYAAAKYLLSGWVYVKENAVLTIEPGTIIKGLSGTKAALIIERGAKLMAAGTAEKPIVFTSDKPKGQRATGDWGGLVICGKAKTNKHDDNVTGQGKAEGGIGSLYGGTDDNDNSGVLQFVRIEFPGISLTSLSNSEINGLTLYSVGKATTIDHIQVSYSGDDSFEWFGGNANYKYLVAWRGLDDDFDTDNGFSGTVQFAVAAKDVDKSDVVSGSNGFESDSDADGSSLEPFTKPIFCNVSLFGPLATGSLPATHYFQQSVHIRRSTQLSVYNSVFVGYPKGLLIDGAKGNTPTKCEDNTVQIENCILGGMTANYVAVTSGTIATPYTVTQIQNYYESANRNNTKPATVAEVIGASLLSLTSPNFIAAAANNQSGASFTNTRLSGNAFIDKTATYRGAFGTTNWTTDWCNFDPQNTDY